MTRAFRDDRDRLLEAHLDGDFAPAAQDAFESRLEHDAELRARLAVQGRVDAALRRKFAAPAPPNVRAWLKQAAAGGAARPRGAFGRLLTIRKLAWAAGIILAVGGGLYLRQRLAQPLEPDRYAFRDLEAVYRDEIRSGFKPAWVCENDQQFAASVWQSFGQPLLLRAAPGVEAVGWSYSNSISPRTMQLLARTDGTPVVVFVDSASNDRGQSLPSRSGLHLYHRTVGHLVLYELTPLCEPRVMDLFYVPDVSEEWLRGGSTQPAAPPPGAASRPAP